MMTNWRTSSSRATVVCADGAYRDCDEWRVRWPCDRAWVRPIVRG